MTEKKIVRKFHPDMLRSSMRKEQAITEMKLGLLEKGGMFQRDERISTVCLRDSRMDMQCNLADDLAAVKNYLELISWEVDLVGVDVVGVDVVGGHHFESMCEICNILHHAKISH